MEPPPPPPPPSTAAEKDKGKQIVEREPSETISLFYEIQPGDPVDCALKGMAISMKDSDPIEGIRMIKSFRESFPRPSHESIDNVLVDLSKVKKKTGCPMEPSKVDTSNDKVYHVKARNDWLFENDPDNVIPLLESQSVSKLESSSINSDQTGPVFSTPPIANFPTHLQQPFIQPSMFDRSNSSYLGKGPDMNRGGPGEFHRPQFPGYLPQPFIQPPWNSSYLGKGPDMNRGAQGEFQGFNRPRFPEYLQQQFDQPPVVERNSSGFLRTRPEMHRGSPGEFQGFNRPQFPGYLQQQQFDQPPVVERINSGFLGTRPKVNRGGPREYHCFNRPPPATMVSSNYQYQPRFNPYNMHVIPNHYQPRFNPYNMHVIPNHYQPS